MPSKKKAVLPRFFNLPPVGVETHAHLDFPDYAEDLDQVLLRARQAGIAWIGNIFLSIQAYQTHRHFFNTIKPRQCRQENMDSCLSGNGKNSSPDQDVGPREDWHPWPSRPDTLQTEARKPILKNRPGLFFTLGVHPHEAVSLKEETIAEMAGLFKKDSGLRAVGEIGLDFYWNHSPKAVQIRAFQDQLALARELDLPVVIHSRNAEQETLGILMDLGFNRRPLLWHCFGKGLGFAAEVLSHGWLISVPGSVTFPKNTDLRETVSQVPLSCMVLETDCPYLTPHPFRGRRNEPAYLVYIAKEIAKLREESIEQVWTECAAAARNYFNLASQDSQPVP